MSEEIFWRRMNPSRLIQLYDDKFSGGVRSGHRETGTQPEASGAGRTRFVDLSPREEDDSGTRLAAYFLGGE